MESKETSLQYISAEGPEGLAQVLEDLLNQSRKDPGFAAKDHLVLYQLGGQRSLIQVDFSQYPFQFYYNDLLGRPVTNKVKEVIATFLWEKCNEKERFFKEFQGD